MSISNNSTVEITFDSGNTWVTFIKNNTLYVSDEIHIIVKPSDLINMRSTTAGGTTVEHCEIFAEV